MPRRTTRHFSDMDAQTLLKAIGECRRACNDASAKAPIGGAVYVATGALQNAIDDLAGVLTGDRDHFHVKAHSTHSK